MTLNAPHVTPLVLSRPVQDLDEWAAVHVPVLPHLYKFCEKLNGSGMQLDFHGAMPLTQLRDQASYYNSLYCMPDVVRVKSLIESVLDHTARITLDDVAHIWWMTKIYYFITKSDSSSAKAYELYTNLLREIKPFILNYKKEATRSLLVAFTMERHNEFK